MPKKGPLRSDARLWEPQDEALLDKLWDQGKSATLIGQELGRTRNSVLSNRRKRGLSGPNRKPTEIAKPKEERALAIKPEPKSSKYLFILSTEREELAEKKARLREAREARELQRTSQDQSLGS